ncbi:glutaminyl-peptide cyclotransferase [Vicingaceae bacterium]|nr:glutaminyl-peptide cyclotransferase [Vicingaceae bacterium]
MSLKRILFIAISVLFIASCGEEPNDFVKEKKAPVKNNFAPNINYTYVNSFPHDTNSFTEGFLIHDGDLWESTGATDGLPQSKSLFGVVDSATGVIDAKVELDRDTYFGEGITFLNGKVYQLTYQSKIGFIYDATSFKELGRFDLPTKEGWGMTTDGTYLIMSDGSNNLIYLDPTNMSVSKTVAVTDNGYIIDNLNELEYINGFVYANVWMTNTVVKIDPANGKLVGKLDLNLLANEARYNYPYSMEMNGIAYDSINNRVLVTGKMWPKYFEIKFKL